MYGKYLVAVKMVLKLLEAGMVLKILETVLCRERDKLLSGLREQLWALECVLGP